MAAVCLRKLWEKLSFSEEFYRCQELNKSKSKLLILEVNHICFFLIPGSFESRKLISNLTVFITGQTEKYADLPLNTSKSKISRFIELPVEQLDHDGSNIEV